jgi:SnoaL-like protein
LSGEYRTTPSPRVRTVTNVLNTNDTVDGPSLGGQARWSIAGLFLEGLTTRDYERLAATLHQGVRFRALLPPGPSEWHGRAETADVFRSWFGQSDRFEVVDATVGEIAGRLQMTWRIRLRPAPFEIGDGWHVIEQHAFADIAESIETLDLVCSGFRAERTSA